MRRLLSLTLGSLLLAGAALPLSAEAALPQHYTTAQELLNVAYSDQVAHVVGVYDGANIALYFTANFQVYCPVDGFTLTWYTLNRIYYDPPAYWAVLSAAYYVYLATQDAGCYYVGK
jgi:hypothetical protein